MSDNHDLSDETFYNPGYKEARKKYMTNPIDNTIDGEVEKILVEMSVDIIDPLASDLEPTQEAIKKITNLIAQEANKAVEAKNYAYWERNQLVGVLSRLYPSHLARHDENDKEWEDDWRNIVCVHTPVGQATWHLQDNDMPMFAHLKRGADHWDGHTTEEKYHRLAQLTADKEQAE